MKLVIERDKWIRGNEEESMLLRPSDGKMCCLGFYSLALGLDKNDIHGAFCPSELGTETYPDWLVISEWAEYLEDDRAIDTSFCNEIMTTNDRKSLAEDEREALLKELFAKKGIEVTFV